MTVTSDDAHFMQLMEEQNARKRVADLAWLNDQRPAEFDVPGEMHPDVAAWFAGLVDPNQVTGSLIMCGDIGCGKTWHIWRIVADLVEKYDGAGRVEVVTAYELQQIAAPPVDRETLEYFAQVELLLFDDVGSVRLSPWDLEKLFAIVDTRLPRRRPLVISSNALDLRAMLGPRIASRLAQNVTLVELIGEDRRRQS